MIFNLDIVMKNTTASLDSNYPEDATVIAGEDVTFKAIIVDEGNPKGYTLQWYVDGKAVEDATGETYTRSTSSDKGVLSVWCEASNKAGTATSRHATLTVKKATALNASFPKDVSVTVGTAATFEIATTEFGYPASYTCQWYLNGIAVPGATGTSFNHYRSIVGTDTVCCVVTNEAGSVTSRTATLQANPLYLYNYGDTCDAASGGWVRARTSSSLSGEIEKIYLEFGANYIQTIGRKNQWDGGCGTAIPFDLTKQTRLNAIAYTTDTTGRSAMFVSSSLVSIDTNALAAVALPTTQQTITLDISNVTSGYVAFSAYSGVTDQATVINAVWLG